MDMTQTPPIYVRKITNVVLIIVTSLLAIVTFFAIQDVLVAITAFIVAMNPTEDWVTVRDTYIVITVRNLWVFIGGILMLALLVVTTDYHSRRIGNPKTLKILLWTLGIEVFFIALSMII